jgi:large subunit ribosomal protein L29
MAREIHELRELNDDELRVRMAEAKAEIFNLRFQLATGKQSNSAQLGRSRHTIARVETLLRSREIDAAEALAASNEVKS